jgi:serine-protein kinase ATM
VQIGWNIVLGDPIRTTLEDDDGEQSSEALSVNDDDMYMDDDPEEDEDDPMPSTTQSLKRRRALSVTPRASSKSQATAKPKSQSQHSQKRSSQPPSLEQIEYVSLLAILLRFPSAPLLSTASPYLASSILRRLHRFIEIYPTDTSMHHDYILSVSATLSHLSLNKKQDVTKFARDAWDGLVALWGTKNKKMKEGLVGILRVLFPFYTATDNGYSSGSDASPKFDCSDGISKLWHLLDGEAESRWGVDGLLLDSLRLEVVSAADEDKRNEMGAFVMNTFRAGWHFDAGQALAWAVLELQADCADKV